MKALSVCSLLVFVIGSAAIASSAAPADQLLGQYYVIHKSLASDSISGVAAAAAEMVKISRQSAGTLPQVKAQLTALADAAGKLQAGDLKSARNGFGDLSDRLIAYLKAAQAKRNPPYQFYCPMVKKNWLQADTGTRNPYYGSSMLTCGELVKAEQAANPPAGHQNH
jgi:hypothetical protein